MSRCKKNKTKKKMPAEVSAELTSSVQHGQQCGQPEKQQEILLTCFAQHLRYNKI